MKVINFKELKNRIGHGKVKEVLKELEQSPKISKEFFDVIIKLKSKWYKYQNDLNNRVISNKEENFLYKEIIDELLEKLNFFEEKLSFNKQVLAKEIKGFVKGKFSIIDARIKYIINNTNRGTCTVEEGNYNFKAFFKQNGEVNIEYKYTERYIYHENPQQNHQRWYLIKLNFNLKELTQINISIPKSCLDFEIINNAVRFTFNIINNKKEIKVTWYDIANDRQLINSLFEYKRDLWIQDTELAERLKKAIKDLARYYGAKDELYLIKRNEKK